MSANILIVGAGAIGGFYGALLAKAGCKVSVVCRSDYRIVSTQGIEIDSFSLGRWTFRPSQVLQHSREYKGDPDFLILCCKVVPSVDRAALLQGAVANKTALVLLQNGVEIEWELQQAFPDNELISGLAFVCCNRTAPGKIEHLAYGRLALGSFPAGLSPATERLKNMFNLAGMECVSSNNIVADRWQKCVWNAPFNPLSVLSGGLSTAEILATQEALVRRIMQEVCGLAEALGYPMPEHCVEYNIEKTRRMPPYKTSMLLDFERGQPMETEAILGNAVRAAKRRNIACPSLQTLYELMCLREQGQHKIKT
ncbi:ketopantoate reductase family protein [Methylomonas sp. HYX-M1]|uniref:ketopantoate reductase family protein n=1 Tax=Methylomonas sp. HYX-M1 TaxID=3139307 RepID=UPI00345BA7B0